MSRWIRGRLGRPMASIVSVLMLVSLLMPLAPPPVRAQAEGVVDWNALVQGSTTPSVPLVVVDFHNVSSYKGGMLGPDMAAALSLSLQDTGKFSVVPRSETESAMQDMNLAVPLNYDALAMLADHLSAPFAVTGSIENVAIKSTKEGTYAEVTVSVIVVSKVTRLPINGARVIQRSSPKLDYTTNSGALVNEALSTAAYQLAHRLIDNRIPIATVLISDSPNSVRLRGGSMIGLQEGMSLAATRQGSLSGLLRVSKVTATDATCTITDNIRGVANGDKVVWVYQPIPVGNGKGPGPNKNIGKKLAPVLALAALAALIGQSGGENNAVSSITAAPMADAAMQGYSDGANVIRWTKQGNHVVKYIVFRISDNGDESAIAVVPGSQNYYIDEGQWINYVAPPTGTTPLAQVNFYTQTYTVAIVDPTATQVSITDGNTGYVSTAWTLGTPAPATAVWKIDVQKTTATVDVYNRPRLAGESCSYLVQPIYYAFDPGAISDAPSHAKSYMLALGEKSKVTDLVTMLAPPVITQPAYTDRVLGDVIQFTSPTLFSYTSLEYVLQVSSSPKFIASATDTITNGFTVDPTDGTVTVNYSVADSNKLANASTIYLRVGARNSSDTMKAMPFSTVNSSYKDYVFSDVHTFNMMDSMLLKNRSIWSTMPMKSSPGKIPTGHMNGRRVLGQ